MKNKVLQVLAAVALSGTVAFIPGGISVHADSSTPEEEYQAAKEQYDLGSIGYFQSHTDDYPLVEKIFDSAKNNYNQSAQMIAYPDGIWQTGDTKDAISLDNMKKSIELISEMNQLRAGDENNGDKTPLKISDAMMAAAQVITDQSAAQSNHGYIGHWIPSEIYSMINQPGENAAWGYGDPFAGWYTAEKQLYDQGNRNFFEVGHYTNIIDFNQSAGLGYAEKGSYGSTSILELGNGTVGKQWDVSDYYTDFMNYYNRVTKRLEDAENELGVKMYRAYNPNSGEHFYTSSKAEFDHIVSLGWRDEGIGWIAPKKSGKPVYRLYNRYGGEHHYTLNKNERDHLVSLGWRDEGIGWYSDEKESVPVYRQYNPYAFANNHNYTTSRDENDHLVSLGWKSEGIGWYALR